VHVVLDKGCRSLLCSVVPSADEVKTRIEAAIPGAQADVETADEVHFSALVRATAFDGLSRVQQHRLVYDVFQGELGGAIHALALKTEVS
jgi:stress-induced morphogen